MNLTKLSVRISSGRSKEVDLLELDENKKKFSNSDSAYRGYIINVYRPNVMNMKQNIGGCSELQNQTLGKAKNKLYL